MQLLGMDKPTNQQTNQQTDRGEFYGTKTKARPGFAAGQKYLSTRFKCFKEAHKKANKH